MMFARDHTDNTLEGEEEGDAGYCGEGGEGEVRTSLQDDHDSGMT